MSDQIERIDVVVTAVYHKGLLLTVYNGTWGAFTLPMTKLRNLQLGLGDTATRWERGAEAAMRNVAECLGFTSTQSPDLWLDVGDLRQSDRSGRINFYQFQIYGFPVADQQVAPGVTAQWLTPEQILDVEREPISPTARWLVEKLKEASLARGGQFPPAPAAVQRKTTASIAIIRQQRDGQPVWLSQWNPRWERYFLIGGHRNPGETADACLHREVGEELRLQTVDYAAQPRTPLHYTGWSTGAWQQTDYAISTFDVTLTPSAQANVANDAANRWLAAAEIRSERCDDARVVSPTVRKILQLVGELEITRV